MDLGKEGYRMTERYLEDSRLLPIVEETYVDSRPQRGVLSI